MALMVWTQLRPLCDTHRTLFQVDAANGVVSALDIIVLEKKKSKVPRARLYFWLEDSRVQFNTALHCWQGRRSSRAFKFNAMLQATRVFRPISHAETSLTALQQCLGSEQSTQLQCSLQPWGHADSVTVTTDEYPVDVCNTTSATQRCCCDREAIEYEKNTNKSLAMIRSDSREAQSIGMAGVRSQIKANKLFSEF